MPMRLLIDPDHGADDLLWDTKGRGVDIDSVPMSAMTREKLRAWQKQWDLLASRDLTAAADAQGMTSGATNPVSDEEWDAHEREGRLIWLALDRDLGPEWQVGWPHYVDGARHVQWSPDGPIEALG